VNPGEDSEGQGLLGGIGDCFPTFSTGDLADKPKASIKPEIVIEDVLHGPLNGACGDVERALLSHSYPDARKPTSKEAANIVRPNRVAEVAKRAENRHGCHFVAKSRWQSANVKRSPPLRLVVMNPS